MSAPSPSPPPAANPAMQRGVHRWAFNAIKWTPTEEEWKLAAACVQQEEKTRIGRFHFKNDAKLSLVGRLLMRKSVAETLAIPSDQVRLSRTPKKKPYLDMPTEHAKLPGYNFNVTHSGDYVLLVSSPSTLIGVDVADIRPPLSATIPGFFDLLRDNFTDEEWKDILKADYVKFAETSVCPKTGKTIHPFGDIRSLPDEHTQLHMFHRYWSLKESYIKAIGIGLGLKGGVKSLSFASDHNLTPATRDPVKNATLRINGKPMGAWRFSQSYIDEEHTVSIAMGPRSAECHFDETGGLLAAATPDGDDSADESTIEAELAAQITELTFEELVAGAVPITSVDHEYWLHFRDSMKEKRKR